MGSTSCSRGARWTAAVIVAGLAASATGCDDKELLVSHLFVCCVSCGSAQLEYDLDCDEVGVPPRRGVAAVLCARRSPCRDAYELRLVVLQYCCPEGCDVPRLKRRGIASCPQLTANCPRTSPCYRAAARQATCELSRTHDAWAPTPDWGICTPGDAATDQAPPHDAHAPEAAPP